MDDQSSIDDLFKRFENFARTVLVKADQKSYLKKLQEEVQELNEEPNMEELADCMLVLVGLSQHLEGDLKEALQAKITKNEHRNWELQDDGTYHHIKTPKP
jgi:predicted house-cleaning noncanonical NTP pyrophosphatase (MazG superfamily)